MPKSTTTKNTKLANCSNGATAAAKQTLHPTGRSSTSYTSLCCCGAAAAAAACVDDDTAAVAAGGGRCDIDVDVAAKDVVAADADRRRCVVDVVAAAAAAGICWCPAAGGFAHDSRP